MAPGQWRRFRLYLPKHTRHISENPLALADSAPEPDIAIVDQIKSFMAPRFTSTHLVIEISVTTKAYDAAKADIYAEAEIPVYWQILPLEKLTIVMSRPIAGKYTLTENVPFEPILQANLIDQELNIRSADIP